MGTPPYTDYIAEESLPKLICDLQQTCVSLHHMGGNVHEGALGQEWECRWRRARRHLAFVNDVTNPGHLFVLISDAPWYWWFFRRPEHCYLDDAIETALARHRKAFR